MQKSTFILFLQSIKFIKSIQMDRKYNSSFQQIPIEVSNPHLKTEVKVIQNQNKIIKKQNEMLRKQLDSLANKLDIEIKKKMEEKTKPWNRSVDSTYLELQNAYKQCDIYKKEAHFYKKKLEELTDDRGKSVEISLCKDYLANQNKSLKEELKTLRKISKFQEKGLEEMGVQGYLKIVNQNKKLSEQIKRLNKQLDEYRRAVHSVENYDSQEDNYQKKSPNRLAKSSYGKSVKTQPNDNDDRKKNVKSDNGNESDEMTEKIQKDYRKICALVAQRNKLREQLAHSRLQISQKDKEIESLRSRIENLRRNNKFMQSQLGIKGYKDIEEGKQDIRSVNNKSIKQEPKYRVWSKNRTQSVNDGLQLRKEERGRSPENTFKWNHQNFASKIVEVQVLVHQQGHIQDMCVKYKKGEPKRLNLQNNSHKYQKMSCRPGQFIKHISGCFSDGYLQCLSLVTSQKRSKVFGNSYLLQGSDEQSQKFEFMIDGNEYPGSFYGQSDEKGISKLGCLIMKQ